MSKTEELLAVLDLSEDEQFYWIDDHITLKEYVCPHCGEQCASIETPADLAFRLRDKVLGNENGTIKWVAGMFDVYMKMTGSKLLSWKWGYVKAHPIHWIIAALITEEK